MLPVTFSLLNFGERGDDCANVDESGRTRVAATIATQRVVRDPRMGEGLGFIYIGSVTRDRRPKRRTDVKSNSWVAEKNIHCFSQSMVGGAAASRLGILAIALPIPTLGDERCDYGFP